MKITSSYGVEIRKADGALSTTLKVYREAVRVLALFYDSVWEEVSSVAGEKKRFNYAEHLVHGTKRNRAVHDFDSRFPKMPSYLRRSAITHALGAVSSYRTRLGQWEAGGRKGRGPVLGERTHAMPVFYRGNMYREAEGDTAFLKLYNGRDWVWVRASLLHTDMEYLRKHWTGVKASAPTLEKRHRKYFLRFSYEEGRELTGRPVQVQRICSVDLGLNTDAVCSIMEADGTVCARKFIDFADEKDRLWKVCRAVQRGTLKKDSGRHCKVRAGGQCGRDRLRAPGHAGEDPRKTEDAAAHMEEARGPEDMHAHGTPERDPGITGMRMEDKCAGL